MFSNLNRSKIAVRFIQEHEIEDIVVEVWKLSANQFAIRIQVDFEYIWLNW